MAGGVSPCLHRRSLTPRPLGRGRGGVGQGARFPSDPGPTGGGWGGARVVCRMRPLTMNVGWELTRMLAGNVGLRNISFPLDISELFHEDITTNISEKCSP